MSIRKDAAVLLLAMVLSFPVNGQDSHEKRHWYDISTIDKDITYADLIAVSEDTLIIENVRGMQSIALDDLIGIRIYKKQGRGIVVKSVFVGAFLGGALGAKAQEAAEERYDNSDALIKVHPAHTAWGVLLGGIGGAIVGNIIKSNSGKDEYIDLRGKTRKELVGFLRKQHFKEKGRGQDS